MNIALWAAQALLALVFAAAGGMKLTRPPGDVRASIPAVADFGDGTLRLIGLLEVLGALGVVLPWGLGVAPWLTPLAALGLALTMVGAALTHLRRGEVPNVAMNAVLLGLALFVAWGRWAAL